LCRQGLLRAAGNFPRHGCVNNHAELTWHLQRGRAAMQTQNNQPSAPTVVPTDKGWQGVTGHNVRYVSLSALSAW
jgi:hypothetical protein